MYQSTGIVGFTLWYLLQKEETLIFIGVFHVFLFGVLNVNDDKNFWFFFIVDLHC